MEDHDRLRSPGVYSLAPVHLAFVAWSDYGVRIADIVNLTGEDRHDN